MKPIPYTEDSFHLPYKNLEEIKKDFFDVFFQKENGKAFLFASVQMGKAEYCIFVEGDSEQDSLDRFNNLLKTLYVPKFRAKYSHEKL